MAVCGPCGSVSGPFDVTSFGLQPNTPVQVWPSPRRISPLYFNSSQEVRGEGGSARGCFLISGDERTWSGCNYGCASGPDSLHFVRRQTASFDSALKM